MWTIAQIEGEELYVLLPEDGSRGLVLGGMDEVKEAYRRIHQLIASGFSSIEIDRYDERLGFRQISAGKVRHEYGIPGSTIRSACQRGAIEGASKDPTRGWVFSEFAFQTWLKKHKMETKGRRS